MKKIPRDIDKLLSSRSAQIDHRFKNNLRRKLFEEDIMAQKNQPLFKRGLSYVRKAPALAVFAALVVVGTSSALVATNQANTARNAEIEVPADLDGLLTFDEVRAIALKDAPNGSITGIELEREDAGLVYKVKYADGSVRIYNAKTGVIVTKADGAERDASVPADFAAGITAAEARAIALGQRGGTITKIELETEEGLVVYSVRYSDGGRVDVNAKDGSVLRVRGTSNSGGSTNGSSSDDSSNDSDDRSGSNSGSSDNSGSGSGSDDSGDAPDDSDGRSGNSGSGRSGGSDDSSSDD